jgi:hypothetical protein
MNRLNTLLALCAGLAAAATSVPQVAAAEAFDGKWAATMRS